MYNFEQYARTRHVHRAYASRCQSERTVRQEHLRFLERGNLVLLHCTLNMEHLYWYFLQCTVHKCILLQVLHKEVMERSNGQHTWQGVPWCAAIHRKQFTTQQGVPRVQYFAAIHSRQLTAQWGVARGAVILWGAPGSLPARSRVEILSSSLQQKLELSLNISAVSGSSCLTKISLGCLFEETYYWMKVFS